MIGKHSKMPMDKYNHVILMPTISQWAFVLILKNSPKYKLHKYFILFFNSSS